METRTAQIADKTAARALRLFIATTLPENVPDEIEKTRPELRAISELLAKTTLGLSTRFFGEWMADTVELIRSEPSSVGSRHTTVAAVPFSNHA
jgi:2'-5' RNA ligase